MNVDAVPVDNLLEKAEAARAAWNVVLITSPLLVAQWAFAAVYIVGLIGWIGVEESLLEKINFFGIFSTFGELGTYLGFGMTASIGIMHFLIAGLVFLFSGVKFWKMENFFLRTTLCFAGYCAPAASLVPWVWLWCLYVALGQGKK